MITGLAVLRRLAAGETLGDADHGWLAAVAARYLDGAADGVRLDEVFGLSVPVGGEPWWAAERRQQRDRHIRALRRFYPSAPAITAAIRRYLSAGWIRDRSEPTMPERYFGTATEPLWLACTAANGKLPVSERQIRTIIGGDHEVFIADDSGNAEDR